MPVRQWIEEHPQVHALFWPARSPDINPIEMNGTLEINARRQHWSNML